MRKVSVIVDLKAEPGEWRRLKGGRFFSAISCLITVRSFFV
jgi:hypothetical protein